MHFVSLIAQANQCASHRNDVVIWMRAEDQHALGKNFVAWSIDISRLFAITRLSTRPTSDRFLQISKDDEVDVMGTPVARDKILQMIFVVILGRQFQNCFLGVTAQPNDCLSNHGWSPINRPRNPRCALAFEMRSCRTIQMHFNAWMCLQKGCGNLF